MVTHVHVDHDAVESRQPGHAANLLRHVEREMGKWMRRWASRPMRELPIQLPIYTVISTGTRRHSLDDAPLLTCTFGTHWPTLTLL